MARTATIGDNSEARPQPTSDDLRRVMSNIQKVQNERRQASGRVRDAYSDAVALGFDRATLRLVVRLSEMEEDERSEFLARLDWMAGVLRFE